LKFPERRHHTRIMTLKNAAWFFGILLVLFLAVSTFNEFRGRHPSGERLFAR